MQLTTIPSQPFRGLESFRYIDRDIFAGRKSEIEKLLNLVLLYRGILVYGTSGIGKSSLIASGLVKELIDHNFCPNIVRLTPSRNNTFVVQRIRISEDQKEEFLPSTFDEFIEEASDRRISLSLDEFEGKLNSLRISAPTKAKAEEFLFEDETPKLQVPVIIFDQFEELITFFEESSSSTDNKSKNQTSGTVKYLSLKQKLKLQEKIIELIRQFYYNYDLPVKLIFIFREDYLAKFSKLFKHVPDLNDHFLRIKPLQVSVLEEIVRRPFSIDPEKTHFKYPFDDTLVLKLTEKFNERYTDGNLMLSEVQIVCAQLYNINSNEERLNKLNAPDGLSKIIEEFQLALINKLKEEEKNLAIDVLSLLVLNDKVRNVLHKNAITNALTETYSEALVDKVLKELEEKFKLVKKESRKDGVYYEIVSESIIPFINQKKIEKERDVEYKKRRIKKRNRALFAMACVGILAAFFLSAYIRKHKERTKKEIADIEKNWYERIPSDNIRDNILELLADHEKGSDRYLRYRTSFTMIADVFDYVKDQHYNDALAAAYFSFSVDSNNVTYSVFEQIRNNTFMPAYIKDYKEKSTNTLYPLERQIRKVIPAKGGDYFIVFSDQSLRFCTVKNNYLHKDLSPFSNSENYWLNFLYSNDVVNISPVFNHLNSLRYVVYNKTQIFVFNPWTKNIESGIASNYSNNNIARIIPFSGNKIKVFLRNGDYEIYNLVGDQFMSSVKGRYLAGKLLNYQDIVVFSNNSFYKISNSFDFNEKSAIYDVNNGESTVSGYNVLDINKNNIQLIQQGTQLKVRSKNNMVAKDLKGDLPAELAIKDNVVITSDHDNAFITYFKLDTAGNVSVEKIDSIPDLPRSFSPCLSPNSSFAVFKKKDEGSFLIYNLAKKEKRYLFVPPSEKQGYDANLNSYRICFLNDTSLIVYSGTNTYVYNIFSLRPVKLTDYKNSHKITLLAEILNSGFYFRHQKEILKIAFDSHDTLIIKNLINSSFDKGDYLSVINYARQLCNMVSSKDNKLFAYKIISRSYENLRRNLGYDVSSASKQLFYAKQVFDYKRKIDSISSDSSTRKDLSLARGSLSWYLILNKNFKEALNQAQIALQGKYTGTDWIHTNLAISYYLNDKKEEAYAIYKNWKNRKFDNQDSARTLFINDINSLEQNYKIKIPDKDYIFKLINTK